MSNEDNERKMQELSLIERLRDSSWIVRKCTFEQIHNFITGTKTTEYCSDVETLSYDKIVRILDDLVEERHPNVLLKGLECVEALFLKKSNISSKGFIKLIDLGLERFPLQQRKVVLEKYVDVLEIIGVEPSLLKSKLSLPHEKCVLFIIEIIGALKITALIDILKEMSKNHNKECIRELALEIVNELEEKEDLKNEKSNSPALKKNNVTSANSKQSKNVVISASTSASTPLSILLEKLPCFPQLLPKEQQEFSSLLVQHLPELSFLPPFILQVMIEDPNHVTSSNGLKLLKEIVTKNQMFSFDFSLITLFVKFKIHATHPINHLLHELMKILCVKKGTEVLMTAVDAMTDRRGNVRFGGFTTFIKVIETCLHNFKEEEESNEKEEHYHNKKRQIQIICEKLGKNVEKIVLKGIEILSKEKEYEEIAKKLKQSIYGFENLNIENGNKNILNTKTVIKVKKTIENKPLFNLEKKFEGREKVKNKKTGSKIISLHESFEKILILMSKENTNELENIFWTTISNLHLTYDLFFYIELVHSFLLRLNEVSCASAELLSQFLVEYLCIITDSRRNLYGLDLFLEVINAQLALGKEIPRLLSLLENKYEEKEIISAIGKITHIKKKNEKYLKHWLQQRGAIIEHLFIEEPNFKKSKIEALKEEKRIEEEEEKYQREEEELKTIEENPKIMYSIQFEEAEEKKYKQFDEQQKKSKNKEIMAEEELKEQKKNELKKHFFEEGNKYENQIEIKANLIKQETYIKYNENDLKMHYNINKEEEKQNNFVEKEKNKTVVERIQKIKEEDIFESKECSEENNEFKETNETKEFFKKTELKKLKEKVIFSIQIENEQYYKHDEVNSFEREFSRIEKKEYEKEEESEEYVELKYLDESKTYKEEKKEEKIFFKNDEIMFEEKRLEKSGIENKTNNEEILINNKKSMINHKELIEKYNVNEEPKMEENEISFKEEKVIYKLINSEKIRFMLTKTNNPYVHLRTMILIPYKAHPNKEAFLKEFLQFIREEELIKPQPFNSVLLLVILLFEEIKEDRHLINPLQNLYESLIRQCTTETFIEILLSILHTIIEELSGSMRKFTLVILAKSLHRLMPCVENCVRVLCCVQEFYQAGEIIYFDMYPEEYAIVKTALEEEVEGLVEGAQEQEPEWQTIEWGETHWKTVVNQYIVKINANIKIMHKK